MTKQSPCLFCSSLQEETIFNTKEFFVVFDAFPVNKGHALIVPKKHRADLFSLKPAERRDLRSAIKKTKVFLDKKFRPDGYNLGINAGEAGGQTIFHLHLHVIPRYKEDVKNPRGGIRNFKKPLVKY